VTRDELYAMQLPLMVSRFGFTQKPNKGDYASLQENFANAWLNLESLVEMVAAGRAFTARHEPERRAAANWHSSQMVVLDLEKHPKAALDEVELNPFYGAYGTFCYTTFSHTERAPRSRVVFLLEHPLADVSLWHALAVAVCGLFGDACDPASADVSRAFLGNPDAELRVPGGFIPADVVAMLALAQLDIFARINERHAARQREFASPARDAYDALPDNGKQGQDLRIFDRWLEEIRSTPEGGRSDALNRRAFLAGKHLVAKHTLSEDEAYRLLMGAALACGLDKHEAHATITQALRKGANAAY